jgi:hypothetical protein
MGDSQSCAFEACKCEPTGETMVRKDGAAYCSERCADGRGCDHADCNCGDFPAPEPEN